MLEVIVWTGAGLALLTAILLAWRAMSCAAGWRAWICYQLDRVHARVFTHWRAENACTIPEFGPAIIVANHTSPADPPTLWIRHFASFQHPRIRVIGFIMAREFARGFPVGWIARSMESILVGRSGSDMAPMREALRRLEAGHLLGVFPEGRINFTTPDEQLLPGGTGVAWLALKSGAPVIPIHIRNAPRDRRIIHAFLKRTHTSVKYGAPVDLSRWTGSKPVDAALTEVTDTIMQAIADLGGLKITPVTRVREPADRN
jgi:1-acyl-sn-glycerol-3-phosphate acyltransferase